MENEKKKTKTKRLVILLAMLALIVFMVALGGTTFAKYITSQKVESSSATVAKWGFVVTADTKDLFSKRYNATAVVKDTEPDTATVDVKASSAVVAPGTKGKLDIIINGVAEVDAKLTFTVNTDATKDVKLSKAASGTEGQDGYVAAVNYAPLTWKLTGSDGNVIATDGTLADCLTKLAAQTENITAGTELTNKTYKLEWEWLFDNTAKDANADAYDTLLGYAAADKDATDKKFTTELTGYTADIEVAFELSVVLTQTTNATGA